MAMNEKQIPSLHEWLDQEQGVENEQFQVTNEQQADWVLRKLRKNDEDFQADVELATAEIERINVWLEQKREQHDRNRDYFQGKLAEYALNRRKDDPKFKSLGLPNGRIRFKKQQAQWDIADEKLVVQSLKDAGLNDLIKVTEKPKKADIKKRMSIAGNGKIVDPETGGVIDGITVTEREDKFEWEVK